MRIKSIVIGGMLVPTAAAAGTLDIAFTIPRVKTLEYHRPYVAIWIESSDRKTIRMLALWYDKTKTGSDGEKYLSGLRDWWRRRARAPADAVSGPTRAPGPQRLMIGANRLAGLAPGKYVVTIEAARELGGQEAVRIPIDIPASGAAAIGQGGGKSELGAARVSAQP